jgi:hypothetical protein
MLPRVVLAAAVALMGWSGVAVAAEKLGPDGFPADWKKSDFNVAAAVSGSHAAVYNVADLPHVGSSTLPPIVSKTQAVSPPVALPQVKAEDTGPPPDTLADLAAYGPLEEEVFKPGVWPPAVAPRGVSATAGVLPEAVRKLLRGGRPGGEAAVNEVLRDALRRALLARAPAPLEVSGSEPWLAQRALALESLDFYEAADGLWRAVGPKTRLLHPALARGWVTSRLLAGQTGEACQLASNQVLNTGAGPLGAGSFWRQAVMACQAISGQREPLGLSLQLAEADKEVDPFLRAVAEAVREDRAVKGAAPARVGPLAAAVLAAYPALIEENWLPGLPDVAWRRLVRTEGLPWRLRTRAAELLAARTRQAADVDVVRAFYAAADVRAVDWLDPLGGAEKLMQADPALGRAILWQAAAGKAGTVNLRAMSWQKWALAAEMSGAGGLVAPLSPDAAGLKPAPELAWLAPLAQSLVWQRGGSETDWLGALRDNASVSPALKKETGWLAVEAGLMAGKVPADAWQEWLGAGPWDAAERLRAARLLALADGLGIDLPAAMVPLLQQKLGEFEEMVAGVRPLWASAVEAAVIAKQAGTALVLMNERTPGDDPLSPPLLVLEVDSLATLGLTDEARRLAATALAEPLVNEEANPPAPTINGGKRAVEKVKRVGGRK